MPRIAANGIDIEYRTHGSKDDPALLMVNGFTSQMPTGFHDDFCEMLAARGCFVVRYDNRDVGLSTHLTGKPAPFGEIVKARRDGTPMPEVAYTMSEMAADGMELLSALGIEKAHIAGVSMGGMLVQTMAIEQSTRVLTLTSIMSTTGEPDYFTSTPEANAALMVPPAATRAEYIAQGVECRKVWSSQKYYNPEYEAGRLGADWDRGIDAEGNARQMCAIRASAPRDAGLRLLKVPTLVIHGRDDTLIEPSGGFRTAELIPGATLAYLSDMGHDLPRPLWPTLVDLMISHQGRAVVS
jgi:pimeloyl-ACP methyl ester carboxylesterase